MKKIFVIFLLLPAFAIAQKTMQLPALPVIKKDTASILKFGALGDGNFINTQSIQKTIDAQAKKGGGVVMIPAGLYLTGPLVLESNINLYLASGATLLFTSDLGAYKLEVSNWEGLPQMRNQSPISAKNAQNISITGNGIIDGNGDAWRMVKKDKLNETQWKKLVAGGGMLSEDKKTWYPSASSFRGAQLNNPGVIAPGKDAAYYENVKDFLRPNMILFTSCKNTLLEGVTFQNSPAWCLHPLMCNELTVRNVKVKNPWYAQNGDGIDVESCSNVLIENSIFDVGDDGLCIKSGRDEAGRKRNMPTQNVLIRNCTVYAAHGGFVIGSEMSGGAKNITVDNCTFIGTDIGLRFKTTRGRGGVVENILVSNIFMKNIGGEAILFDMYYTAKDPLPLAGEKRELPQVAFEKIDETTPIFQNFTISNIYCNGAQKAIFMRGLPEMHVKNISITNMACSSDKGIDVQEASNIKLKNITLTLKDALPVIDITQSDNIKLDKIKLTRAGNIQTRINGDRAKNIMITASPAITPEQLYFELGATSKSVLLK